MIHARDRLDGADLEELRRELLLHPEGARLFDPLDGIVHRVGRDLAVIAGLSEPLAARLHHSALPWHRDQRMPYPCMNLTLWLRSARTRGGMVEFVDGTTLDAADGEWAAFDGQFRHRVAPFRGGYRLSLTYYCPLG